MSAGPNPNRWASMTPGPATFSWVQRTALGSPLVPDVKMSMNSSSKEDLVTVICEPRNAANSSDQSGPSTSSTASASGIQSAP